MQSLIVKLCLSIIFVNIISFSTSTFAQNENSNKEVFSIRGKLVNCNGDSIKNALITITPHMGTATTIYDTANNRSTIYPVAITGSGSNINRYGTTDKNGIFTINNISTGIADIEYKADKYYTIRENHSHLYKGLELIKTMYKNEIPFSNRIMMLLLIPGFVLILYTYVKKRIEISILKGKKADGMTSEKIKDIIAGHDNPFSFDNPFFTTFVNVISWSVTLLLFAFMPYFIGNKDVYYNMQLFHSDLQFEFYIPFLGLIGSLLFVLNIIRKGPETSKEQKKDFGIRLAMGPYLSIIMVVLFGQDLAIVNLDTAMARGGIAFFSGLLAVMALQGLIEKGTEMINRWIGDHYEPTDIAKRFSLTEEEDLELRKAGINHLIQLRDINEDKLKNDLAKVNFDENYALSLKTELVDEKKQLEELEKSVGQLIATRLMKNGIKSINEVLYITEENLKEIADEKPSIEIEMLTAACEAAKQKDSETTSSN